MLKFLPIIALIAYAWISYRVSVYLTHKDLTRNSTLLHEPLIIERVARIAKVLDIEKIPVYIYNIAPINGLAAPDGRIFLTRGLLEKYKSGFIQSDELVAVIAHELGHVALGHARRRGIEFLGQNALRVLLTFILGRFAARIAPYIANFITTIMLSRLMRRDEFEADAYAAALLINAEIGTAGLKSLFRKLDGLNKGAGNVPVWISSHPKSSERIKAIERCEARWAGD